MNEFVESKVRTNRLHCSGCKRKLKKGETVMFELVHGSMKNVFGHCCQAEDMVHSVVMNSIHPFSSEALGQD